MTRPRLVNQARVYSFCRAASLPRALCLGGERPHRAPRRACRSSREAAMASCIYTVRAVHRALHYSLTYALASYSCVQWRLWVPYYSNKAFCPYDQPHTTSICDLFGLWRDAGAQGWCVLCWGAWEYLLSSVHLLWFEVRKWLVHKVSLGMVLKPATSEPSAPGEAHDQFTVWLLPKTSSVGYRVRWEEGVSFNMRGVMQEIKCSHVEFIIQ